MKANWRVFTNAHDKESARVLLKRTIKALGVEANEAETEPYYKGGFLISFGTVPASSVWSERVVELIVLAEKIGRGWILLGSIVQELNLWSNESTIAGVQSIHLNCKRNEVGITNTCR
jgi:hypothetical protein